MLTQWTKQGVGDRVRIAEQRGPGRVRTRLGHDADGIEALSKQSEVGARIVTPSECGLTAFERRLNRLQRRRDLRGEHTTQHSDGAAERFEACAERRDLRGELGSARAGLSRGARVLTRRGYRRRVGFVWRLSRRLARPPIPEAVDHRHDKNGQIEPIRATH